MNSAYSDVQALVIDLRKPENQEACITTNSFGEKTVTIILPVTCKTPERVIVYYRLEDTNE